MKVSSMMSGQNIRSFTIYIGCYLRLILPLLSVLVLQQVACKFTTTTFKWLVANCCISSDHNSRLIY